MSSDLRLSVVVPFYNSENYLENCLEILDTQDFKKPFEIIFVNDGSTDNGLEIINRFKSSRVKVFSLKSNLGPSAARNVGIQNSRGKYIYFLDADDAIEKNSISILFAAIKEKDYDFVFSDKKWMENNLNLRENTFDFTSDREFINSDFIEAMTNRFHDPISTGKFFGLTGRLIKRSLLIDNKIMFEEKLRYLEDDTFMWDVLGYAQNAKYIKKQLYSYYIRPNLNTALSQGINIGYPVSNFKLVSQHIFNSLKLKKFSTEDSKIISQQGLIFFIISALISYTRSILQGKINIDIGIRNRRKIIDEIIDDKEVAEAIKKYSISPNENYFIPKAIKWRSKFLLEKACDLRAKSVLKMRKKN